MEFVVLRFIRMKNKFPVINFPTRCFDFSTDLSCLALIVAPTCELLRTQRINIAAASLMNLVTVAIHELKCCNENCNTYNTLYFDRDFDIPSLVISKNIFLHSSEERERERSNLSNGDFLLKKLLSVAYNNRTTRTKCTKMRNKWKNRFENQEKWGIN